MVDDPHQPENTAEAIFKVFRDHNRGPFDSEGERSWLRQARVS